MFTGLIETVGRVADVSRSRGSTRIGIASTLPVAQLEDGESIAVDGVCLTVTRRDADRFYADVVAETLSRSTLGEIRPGSRVNLERAMRLGDRIGGHLVQGHVDTTVLVKRVLRGENDRRLQLALVPEIRAFVAEKGSVALQGVSLTVAAVRRELFEVALVPHTLEHTTLGEVVVGGRLNVEVDLLARYLERLMDVARGGPPAGGTSRARGARGGHD